MTCYLVEFFLDFCLLDLQLWLWTQSICSCAETMCQIFCHQVAWWYCLGQLSLVVFIHSMNSSPLRCFIVALRLLGLWSKDLDASKFSETSTSSTPLLEPCLATSKLSESITCWTPRGRGPDCWAVPVIASITPMAFLLQSSLATVLSKALSWLAVRG